MMNRSKTTVRYHLSPSQDDREAILLTLDGYRRAMAILSGTSGSNLVALHEEAYERIRDETGIPSRLATLALRDKAHRIEGTPIDDMPLDAKLMSVKGPDSLSLATTSGRRTIPYAVTGYESGWGDFCEARLRVTDGQISIDVGIESDGHPQKETPMSTESLLSRVGRVIAGSAHSALEAMEQKNPKAVAEQAVREIDAVIADTRGSLAKAQANEFRIKTRIREIDEEIADLAEKIGVGLKNGREDLAKQVIGLQLDLEAQKAAMEKALADARDDIADATQALQAARSARADANARLTALDRSLAKAGQGPAAETPSQRNEDRIARSMHAIERVTGTPARPSTAAAEVDELARLQRQEAIERRLEAFKGSGL